MAVYTSISAQEGEAVAQAHQLGAFLGVDPIAAGSVNTNYFLNTASGRYFLRVYEEQQKAGVAYEWSLLSHLRHHGVAVPQRVSGPSPGEVTVGGKPTAVFELIGGDETCQRGVTLARARALGRELGRCHVAAADFPQRQVSRFDLAWLGQQLAEIENKQRPELRETTVMLRSALEEAGSSPAVINGVIHGDLFRDNVRWEGDTIVGLLDWESASDGVLAYDIMVTVLAWCFGDTFDWDLARGLMAGYESVRPINAEERLSFRGWAIAAAARFSITRILSYHLREDAIGVRVMKDYRRFVQRLELLRGLTADEVASRLTPTS